MPLQRVMATSALFQLHIRTSKLIVSEGVSTCSAVRVISCVTKLLAGEGILTTPAVVEE